MENKVESTYRRIVSSTAVFGGAQVLSIIVNIIKGKLVASILHSWGMGMSSILSNAATSLQQLSLMGLNVSAVPGISQAHSSGDSEALLFTIRIVRRLVLIASVFGLVLTLALSPLMSELSFGSSGYTRYFLLLALAVFFNVMGTGELAVMQGMRRYKLLAICSIVPPCCGLLLSVPIYFIWGIEGIVPAMILLNLVYFVIIRALSYRAKQHQGIKRISMREVWTHGQGIVKFGIVMTIGVIAGTLTTYALTAFINNQGSLEDVGFYQAGNAITLQYIGLIFAAMAADFYPHLSSLVKENQEEAFLFANQQTEIVVLIVTPLVMLLILTAPLAIRILLTTEFLPIEQIVRFLGMAGIFKAICFPMDYIAYAKGDTRFIFWLETVWGCSKTFAIMAGSYILFGLEGLGYGALAVAVVDVIVSIALISWRYGFHLSQDAIRIILSMTILSGTCLACSFIADSLWRYLLMALLTVLAFVISIHQLHQRLDLKNLLGRLKSKMVRRKEA